MHVETVEALLRANYRCVCEDVARQNGFERGTPGEHGAVVMLKKHGNASLLKRCEWQSKYIKNNIVQEFAPGVGHLGWKVNVGEMALPEKWALTKKDAVRAAEAYFSHMAKFSL